MRMFRGVIFCVAMLALQVNANKGSEVADLAYTNFEREVTRILSNSSSQDGYLSEINNLAQKFSPLSKSERAYLNYQRCVLGDVIGPDDIAFGKLSTFATSNEKIAFYLCKAVSLESTSENEQVFQSAYLAYTEQNSATSAPLKYLANYYFQSQALRKGLIAEGIAATSKMLDIGQTNNIDSIVNVALSSRAILQVEVSDFDNALENIDKAISRESRDIVKLNLMLDKGYILSSADRNNEAIGLYNDLLDNQTSLIDDITKIIIYSNLSHIYANQRAYQSNLSVTEKMMNLVDNVDDEYYVMFAKISRAYALLDVGRVEEAEALFIPADQWFKDNGYLIRTAEGYQTWAEALSEQGLFKKAFQYLEKSTELYSKIREDSGRSELELIDIVLEAERQQRALKDAELQLQLTKEKQRAQVVITWVVGISVLVIVAVTVFAYARLKRLNLQLDKANKHLKHENSHDPLTGAFNRRYFYRFLENSQATGEVKKALIGLIDIDYFKKLNDTYGHDIGDKVLQILVNRLKSATKSSDLVVRWGGEEFLLYLDLTHSESSTRSALNRIVQDVNKTPFKIGHNEFNVTISMGFKVIDHSRDINEEVKMIDNYLYQAKRNGRSRAVGVFDDTLSIESI